MAHWRDGGIGNMAGHDERPFEEWTLLEKLRAVADTKQGGLKIFEDDLPYIAEEAFEVIEQITRLSRQITKEKTSYKVWDGIPGSGD